MFPYSRRNPSMSVVADYVYLLCRQLNEDLHVVTNGLNMLHKPCIYDHDSGPLFDETVRWRANKGSGSVFRTNVIGHASSPRHSTERPAVKIAALLDNTQRWFQIYAVTRRPFSAWCPLSTASFVSSSSPRPANTFTARLVPLSFLHSTSFLTLSSVQITPHSNRRLCRCNITIATMLSALDEGLVLLPIVDSSPLFQISEHLQSSPILPQSRRRLREASNCRTMACSVLSTC